MARDTKNMLESVEFKIRKTFRTTTDPEKIKMIQSVYDANIDTETAVQPENVFPTVGCEVSISWEESNEQAVLERQYHLLYDNFTDEIVNDPFDQQVEPVFGVNDDFLILSTGTFLRVT